MISKIGPANQVNFQALIKIRKSGVTNLLKDSVDISKIGSRTSTSASSGIAESTAFPADIASEGNALSASMRSNADAIKREANNISTRDLKTVESEKPNNMGEDLRESAIGSSSISSGVGLYSSTAATALEQSAHNPHSIYAGSIHDGLAAISTPKSAEVMGNIENFTQEYSVKGLEYQQGQSNSTKIESLSGYHATYGSLSNWAGSTVLKNNFENIVELKDIEKNIPS
jgi:hypothetical protein